MALQPVLAFATIVIRLVASVKWVNISLRVESQFRSLSHFLVTFVHPVYIVQITRQHLRIKLFSLLDRLIGISCVFVAIYRVDDGVNDNDRAGCRWAAFGRFHAGRRTSMLTLD